MLNSGRKRLALLLVFLLSACKAARPLATDKAEFNGHPAPLVIFSVGNYGSGYRVLILTDARQQYFTIIAKSKDNLQKGTLYQH